jgi:hypothetical protein
MPYVLPAKTAGNAGLSSASSFISHGKFSFQLEFETDTSIYNAVV